MPERVGFVPARDKPASRGAPEASLAAKTELSEGLAERVGVDPTCPLRDKTLSRRPRYDHFGTSPQYGIRDESSEHSSIPSHT